MIEHDILDNGSFYGMSNAEESIEEYIKTFSTSSITTMKMPPWIEHNIDLRSLLTQLFSKQNKTKTIQEIINFIDENRIDVDDGHLLDSLLNKLDEEELKLLKKIMDALLNTYKYNFSIKVFDHGEYLDEERKLEEIYIVLKLKSSTPEERVKEFLDIVTKVMSMDKDNRLWFIGFSR